MPHGKMLHSDSLMQRTGPTSPVAAPAGPLPRRFSVPHGLREYYGIVDPEPTPATEIQEDSEVTSPLDELASSPDKETDTEIDQIGGYFRGFYQSGREAVAGIASLGEGLWDLTGGWIVDPETSRQTWQQLNHTVRAVGEDPGLVWESIKQPYVTAWAEGRYGEALGRGTFEALSAVVGLKGLDKLARGNSLARQLHRLRGPVPPVSPSAVNPHAWATVRRRLNRKAPALARPNPLFPQDIERVEWSHWLPQRSPLPQAIKNHPWNLKPMWATEHALSDPARYRFMSPAFKHKHRLPNALTRSWHRMPDRAQGTLLTAPLAGESASHLEDEGEDEAR